MVIDADLEASGTPVDQVEAGFGLERGNGSISVTRYHIPPVEKCHSHVFAVTRIANNHLVAGFEALQSEVVYLEAFMRGALGGHDRRVTDERVVDARIWHQVGLELVQVDIESTIESQAGGNRRDNLSNETVEVFVVWSRNVQIATADIVHGLVVNQESAVGVLNGAMGGENRVVGLNHRGRDLRCRVDGELQLALLSIVDGQSLKEESSKSRTGTTTKRVEDQETLQRSAVVLEACQPMRLFFACIQRGAYRQRDESCPKHRQQALYQWCNVLLHSCLPRLPCH